MTASAAVDGESWIQRERGERKVPSPLPVSRSTLGPVGGFGFFFLGEQMEGQLGFALAA
jgi:hypothetical protein